LVVENHETFKLKWYKLKKKVAMLFAMLLLAAERRPSLRVHMLWQKIKDASHLWSPHSSGFKTRWSGGLLSPVYHDSCVLRLML